MSANTTDGQSEILESTAPTQGKNPNELDHIRDILFGTQSREMEQRIEALEAALQTLSSQLRDQLNQQAQRQSEATQSQAAAQAEQLQQMGQTLQAGLDGLSAELQQLRQEVAQAVQRLEHEKTNRVDLGQLLVALGEQLQANPK